MNPKKKPVPSLVQAFVIPVCVIWNPLSRHWIAAKHHAAMTGEKFFAPYGYLRHLRHLRITPPHPDPQPKDPLPGGVEAPNSPSVPTHAPLVHALPDTAPRPPA